MALSWSHAVIYVHDPVPMMDFYTRVLGFEETDRGKFRGGDSEIIFMSQSPTEHHQLAFITTAEGDGRTGDTLAHFAFRVEGMGELRTLMSTLQGGGVSLRPISHGNTWSVYFQDPEGNGIELFCDTRWHVKQPAGIAWDTEAGDRELDEWTEATFRDAEGFEPAAAFYARRAAVLTEA